MLHVIQDQRTAPAHFGAIAALFARALQARGLPAGLMHLPTFWDLLDYPEAVQHVAASGTLLPSGLLWSERLLGMAATLAADLDILMIHARSHDIVLPLHSSVGNIPVLNRASERVFLHRAEEFDEHSPQQRLQLMRDLLKSHAQASGTPIRMYSVQARDGAWSLIDDDAQLAVEGLRYCLQDRFGRWQAMSDTGSAARSETPSEAACDAPGRASSGAGGGTANSPNGADGLVAQVPLTPNVARLSPLHVALIGSERDQYGGYPATLAALGDAADAADIRLTIDFVTPQTLTQQNIAARLCDVHGIVLPGGSDMERVAGQIEAARFAYQSGLPIVGLCLGMQSMATAVARIALNDEAIGLAEVGVSLPGQPYRHSFVPIDDSGPNLHHRLGDRRSQLVPASRLQAILGDVTVTRYNHRYRLNDDLIGPLKTAGVNVCARGEHDREAERRDEPIPKQAGTSNDASYTRYVDAIEAPAHPFFIGMQGHPELSSAEARPHPLLVAFLRAAQAGSQERR